MERIYSGKTKDVFLRDDGNILLKFKDTVTGTGDVIDAGSNTVIGEVSGKGNASLRLTVYFFDLLQKAGMPTHFISTGPEPNTLLVKRAKSFKLEVVCREKAWGSFIRRYGAYIKEGTPLPSVIEFTLKDDEREDPPINEESLVALGIVTEDQIRYMKESARKATAILKAHLAEKGLDLIDIKYEFGEVDGQTIIIDEISGDGMRVVKDGKVLLQKELAAALLGE
ncbi:MAG TPA: phosphoribosylaminoimidazolesuccinocarboxamide synthase [Firmicutes bacterium]|nr:phosphoribosylaminoimidazolesuccinocarboxamide synthase [Candidatus Fermentithermobacillaceae bacterium]